VWPSFYNPWTGTILMWPGMRPPQQQQPTHPPQHALLAAPAYYRALDGPSFTPLSTTPPHQQQAMPPSWSPWICMWDQQLLANSFNGLGIGLHILLNALRWMVPSVAAAASAPTTIGTALSSGSPCPSYPQPQQWRQRQGKGKGEGERQEQWLRWIWQQRRQGEGERERQEQWL
jgi:hypothetical protein